MKKSIRGVFVSGVILGILFFSSAYSEGASVVITEIGAYESSGFEWVEIFNRSEENVDLTNWKFWEGGTNHGLTLKQGDDFVLAPHEFAVITQDDKKFLEKYRDVTNTIFDSSWGTLAEDGEEIGFKFGAGVNDFVEKFTYLATDNFSLEKKDFELDDYTENNWGEHMSGNTVGEKNSIQVKISEPIEENISEEKFFVPSQPPVAVFGVSSSSVYIGTAIFFDASSSFDPDGDTLVFSWNFGDGGIGEGATIEHTYTTTGTFDVELSVIDTKENGSVASSSLVVQDLLPREEKTEEVILEEESVKVEPVTTTTGQLVINEFVPDPIEGKEWVELLNIGEREVVLDGFTLSDGGGVIANLASILQPGEFLVVELGSSKLNNSGDILILKNTLGEEVQRVTYGNWDDGNISDNVSAPAKGNSLARGEVFQESTSPTKGSENIVASPVLEEVRIDSTKSHKNKTPSESVQVGSHFSLGDIVINEVVSDPAEDQEEFIELYNTTNKQISLAGFKIQDGGGTKTFLEGNISSHEFFVVQKPKGNLNNQGDSIQVLDGNDDVIDILVYGDWDDGNVLDNATAAFDPMSLARKVDGESDSEGSENFVLTFDITPGGANHIRGPQVLEEVAEENSHKVIINEIFPNPSGDDSENEYIELYNPTSSSVSLVGWKLADDSQKRYTIQEKVILPYGYAVFLRSVTHISLNNSGGETIQLLDSKGGIVDSVAYEEIAMEDESLAKNTQGDFVWTSTRTLGKENIFTEFVPDAEEKEDVKVVTKKAAIKKVTKKAPKKVLGKKIQVPKAVSLDTLHEYEKGAFVKTTGTVAVVPGVFGSQYFYLVSANAGVQIYNNKKDFPNMSIGDNLEVVGEISEVSGQTRVKTVALENMTFLGPGVLLPQEKEILEIGETDVGSFFQVTGKITEVKTSYMYVDDGGAEIKVYFKEEAGIKKNNLILGKTVKIKGILVKAAGDYQLLPRMNEDLEVLVEEESSVSAVSSKSVLESTKWKNYFSSILVAFIGLLGIGILKIKKEKFRD